MQYNGSKKTNLLIACLFQEDTDLITDLEHEEIMKKDLAKLLACWKECGYIRRFILADDECISDKLKTFCDEQDLGV